MAFEWYKKFRQKWLVKKSNFAWRQKKPTPSTNIPLLSYRKSEQQQQGKFMLLLLEKGTNCQA